MKKPKIVFDTDWILENFSLTTAHTSVLLEAWITCKYELSEANKALLVELSELFLFEGDSWNEEELKINFIALLINVVKPNVAGKIKSFFERNINVETDHFEISVDVGMIFAKPMGKNTPKEPYFFLQELKKGKKSTNDPEAQMLAAMLAAQIKHQNLQQHQKAMYGGYVVGRHWYFAILEEKKYSLSRAFDVTNIADIQQVTFNLIKIKEFAV
jgi:hypothetical protein